MFSTPATKNEEDAAQLCRLILKSFGGDSSGEIRKLINDNPNCVNTPGTTGETPLFLAVNQRDIELSKYLLVAKADANGVTSNGRTALHELASTSSHATAKQDCELVQVLVMYNASVEKYDANRSQPVDIARMYNAPDSVQKALSVGNGRRGGAVTPGTAALSGLSFTPDRHSASDLHSTTFDRPPVTSELMALYSKSSQRQAKELAESHRFVEQAAAQARVDELLANAQRQHARSQNPPAAARIEQAVPDLGPYRLLYDKTQAELRVCQKELRETREALQAAQGEIETVRAENSALRREKEEFNLERANAGEATGKLVEYKRLNQQRMSTIQQALSKLKDEIRESDDEIARLSTDNAQMKARAAADRRLIATLKREIDKLTRSQIRDLSRSPPRRRGRSYDRSPNSSTSLSPEKAERLRALSRAVHSGVTPQSYGSPDSVSSATTADSDRSSLSHATGQYIDDFRNMRRQRREMSPDDGYRQTRGPSYDRPYHKSRGDHARGRGGGHGPGGWPRQESRRGDSRAPSGDNLPRPSFRSSSSGSDSEGVPAPAPVRNRYGFHRVR